MSKELQIQLGVVKIKEEARRTCEGTEKCLKMISNASQMLLKVVADLHKPRPFACIQTTFCFPNAITKLTSRSLLQYTLGTTQKQVDAGA